ncbi:hypothetical protein FRZ61_05240 [Hypericibacter adhaerens]|uniref:DUF1254 domain-containing protein n=1 Tax=Hypericibacter adhaerens TaxID=2602016 RepID=A0A5J6N129_9PROT|nr:DUF1254 domain-containing protein [Hypericibacter adhaerens]QEX20606.1 hypothetical protein FRZ61_05240 [Hypericibacter adhaerens]
MKSVAYNALAAGILLATGLTSSVRAETVETHIGPLEIVNGYPTPEATQKIFDESDFQRATQAYLWGLPAVGFHGLHLAQLNIFGAKDGDVVLYVTLKDKTGMLTPNLTTIYAMSFWNLATQGPLVVIVPKGASAGGVLDIWQRPITDVGQTGPDKGQGGKYLILPPTGDAIVNPEFNVLRSPTNQIWFATRGLGSDPVAAEAVVRGYQLYAYDDRQRPPQTKFIPVGGKDWTSEQPRDLRYWQWLHDVLEPEEPEERDRFFYGMLLPLGIEHGKPFAPDERQKKILTEAAVLGDMLGRATAYAKRVEGNEVWDGKHWEYANMVELDQTFRGYGQIDERGSWYYEAIGNTVGMQGRTLGFGQVYLEAQKDKDGAWLDGGKSYHLRVPADAPVEQFWSFTLYDNMTRGPLITPQGAADISSRKEGLAVNPDGTVDLYFGPNPPPGANANFVQTVPGKGWFTYFRLYGPKQAYFDKSWQLGDIEEMP